MRYTPIHEARFRVVDLETTGIDPEANGVCEVAFYELDAAGNPGPTCEHLTDPGQPIPPEASAVHHITDEDVFGKPKLSNLWPYFHDPETVHVAHNAEFERAFFVRHTGDEATQWLCTQRLAMHLLPGLESYSNQYLRYYLKLDVPEAQGQAAHRAMADVYVTAALLRYLLTREHGCETVGDLIDLAESPVVLQKVTFGKHKGSRWDDVPMDYLEWMRRNGDWDQDTAHTLNVQLRKRRVVR